MSAITGEAGSVTEGLRAIRGVVPQSLEEAIEIGRVLCRSGFFQDSQQEAQAVAKILAGLELAFPPVVSLTGIHLVEGKVTLSACLMAAKVRSHPRYDFRVEWLPEAGDARGCAITFLRDGEAVGVSVFTQDDAERAGLLERPLWRSYLRNMCYARAMANGCRWYAPDAFNGTPVYTPEELGAEDEVRIGKCEVRTGHRGRQWPGGHGQVDGGADQGGGGEPSPPPPTSWVPGLSRRCGRGGVAEDQGGGGGCGNHLTPPAPLSGFGEGETAPPTPNSGGACGGGQDDGGVGKREPSPPGPLSRRCGRGGGTLVARAPPPPRVGGGCRGVGSGGGAAGNGGGDPARGARVLQ